MISLILFKFLKVKLFSDFCHFIKGTVHAEDFICNKEEAKYVKSYNYHKGYPAEQVKPIGLSLYQVWIIFH